MKTPYLNEMINELDGYIGSSDNYLSKKGNEKLTELKAIKKKLLLYSVVKRYLFEGREVINDIPFKKVIDAENRETAIAIMECDYPNHKWVMSTEV